MPLLRAVPLFPLPGVVLFPGHPLPLCIFEPRYRRMMQDVLAGSRRICMVHVCDAQPAPNHRGRDAFPQPRFHEIAGVGRVVHHQKLADGRYNLILMGEGRVRVRELPFEAPYRRGDLTPLASRAADGASPSEVKALAAIAGQFVTAIRRLHPELDLELPPPNQVGALADACAEHFITAPDLRQTLLEELDEGRRVSLCLDGLLSQVEPDSSDLN